MLVTTSATGLFWSLTGHVVCAAHAAAVHPAEWRSRGWQALPSSSQGLHGTYYQCEACSPMQRAISGATVWGGVLSPHPTSAIARAMKSL